MILEEAVSFLPPIHLSIIWNTVIVSEWIEYLDRLKPAFLSSHCCFACGNGMGIVDHVALNRLALHYLEGRVRGSKSSNSQP
jgi:hypothetical protein